MAQSNPSFDLTPKHVRAARALLAWSQQDLAKAACVATSTVADFERGHRTPVANNAQAIRGALESAGIRFMPTGAVIGPAVPGITPTERSGTPIRWVNADDLSSWADRTDSAFSLPTLLALLIRATHGPVAHLRFPADEGVRQSGWDGITFTDIGSAYVPQGHAGWEISSQRSNILQKATTDYQKRTTEPEQIDPTNAAFVFVTPRHWAKKDEWAKARQGEGDWRDVRAYDANDLVHWIEQAPAVGLWLAARLGKRPVGIQELDDLWEEWSLATQWPLTEDLVLSDRDQDAAEVLHWLRGEPSVLSLQATTTDEVVAFFHATLSMLPDDIAAVYRARCLVATTAVSARALVNASAPLILLMTDPEPGLARVLAEHGHFVLQAYDERRFSRGEVRILARPSREGIASALTAAGIAEPRAKGLARDSARNLSVLRRLIPSAPARLPLWAQEKSPHALLVALLVGGWDENVEADRALLAEIADQSYETVIAALTPYVGDFDCPLKKTGSTWCIASPADAWFLLAPYLTSIDITRFEVAAHAVLGSADPRFEMDPNDRWMAAVQGIQRDYSGMLRHGIGQVLILLALWGDRVHLVSGAARRADVIVDNLLRNSDPQRWWSLSRDFRLLAEASPGAFLSAIEDSLDRNDPPIRVLFGTDEGSMFGAEHLSEFLWALESLAWSPDLMPRVTHVLARLDAIDNSTGRYMNRPANSLREIHLLWMPQTYATLDQRLRALDLIRKQESNAAWKLMLGVLPQGDDISSPSPMPRWRDFTVDKVEIVTWSLIGRGAVAITERLLADVGVSSARWALLLDRFANLAPDPEAGLATLAAAEQEITNQADRAVLWTSLRRVLHHHRQFPDAEWSMPAEVLNRLETIYDRFSPSDPLERTAWLFEQCVALPKPSTAGWEAEKRDVDAARREAARMLFSEGGVTSILTLARLVESAEHIGKAIYDSGLSESDLDALLGTALQSANDHEREVANGLVVSVFRDRKEPWAAGLISKAKDEAWGDTALLTILRALPFQRWTWEIVAQAGAEIENTYWRRAPVFWMSEDCDDVAFAIRKLISVGRARHALPLGGRGSKAHLPSVLLVEVLREAVRQPFESGGNMNEATMFRHYVAEILQVLDERGDVDRDTLVALEWSYLPVLEHSPRPVKVLLRALSEQPALFIEMLSAVFKAKEDSDVEPENPEHARAVAHQAFRLLELWNRLPGTRDNGTIDGKVLEDWIKEARSLAKVAGREDIADSRIGNMLSASPAGADGNWPAEAVRDVIDLFRSKRMIEGFQIGKRNRRGVTTRMPRDGGNLERQEAAKYRNWAKAIACEHPHTSKALDNLADSYEDQARRHDEDAERLDWEH
ncbi:helix-turn-helix transcriptional regulator [Acidithiobacillus thiooxidans]|uniref:helix-turn-helix domain-containing protein n=1 Tax=Acidithiobacillus thiooxidans TaxID=930 RepID=UPI00285A72C5|nr:helix-turn-helix transcriptional regulator [Acidithiobacillus thiooxidans]MDR7927036.1 helix-turn-helix transcriptional regulator [Acidithiobacillus thiooxidans]